MTSTHKILVTGDNGFVGSALLRHFKAVRPEVEVLSLVDPATGLRPDLRDAPGVCRAVEDAKPTAVIHLAGVAAPADAKADPRRAWEINFVGTFNVAQAIVEGAPAAHLIFTSSAEAYGLAFNSQTEPLLENAPLLPLSVYGATKAAAEVMLGQLGRTGLNLTIFRPFNHTGVGQKAKFVVSSFASQVAAIEAGRQSPVIVVGDLSPRRDFLDVDDIARAYADAATGPMGTGKIYNLATGNAVSVGEVLDALRGLARVPTEVVVDEARLRPGQAPIASGNAELARQDFGWSPRIPLQQSLSDVLDYWRGQA